MAARKRLKFDYEMTPQEIAKAFSTIGEDARDFLEAEIVYGEDSGRRSLAREILGYATEKKESKVKRNVEG